LKIISLLYQIRHSSVVNNFFYTAVFQVSNLLIPVITLPYLTKVIGLEKVGVILLLQSVMMIFTMIVDYGFAYTAVRELSINRHDVYKRNIIFNNVLQTKIFLCLCCFIALILLIFIYPKLKSNYTLSITSFVIVLGNTFNPLWFFQGLEKVKIISNITLLTRLFFTSLIFFFVNDVRDSVFINIFIGLGTLTSGVISLFILNRKLDIVFIFKLNWNNIKISLKDGYHLFISVFLIGVFSNINVICLGLFADEKTIGLFSLSEKVSNVIRQLAGVYSQVIYPQLCLIISNKGKVQAINYIRKSFIPFSLMVVGLCISIFYYSDIIAHFLTNKYEETLSIIIRYMIFLPLINVLNIPFYRILLAYQENISILKVLFVSTTICIFLNMVLAYFFKEKGTIVAVMLTELSIVIGLIYFTKKKLKSNSFNL
jgi:polysaccharide transporter, PST family